MSPDGKRVIFTSTRDGDVELYTMNPDGSDVRRLTTRVGYDGGAFFSPDGTQDRLAGAVPGDGHRQRRLPAAAEGTPGPPGQARALGGQRRRQQPEADHRARRRQLRAVLPPGREADHLLVEPQGPEGPRLRPLPDQRRRHGNREDHQLRRLRRLPDVLARRQAAGLRVEPARQRSRARPNLFIADWKN